MAKWAYDLVIQEDVTGCGLACIAMLSHKTYDDIKDCILSKGIIKSKKNFMTNNSQIIRIGKEFGVTLEKRKKFQRWNDIPSTSLVSINFRHIKSKSEWHWIVFVKENGEKPYFLDPLENKKQKKSKRFDFKGKKSGYYLLLVKD
jgi:ABC-type bacteriocin/lantibiotic exporter with double-glycine peptidase domain